MTIRFVMKKITALISGIAMFNIDKTETGGTGTFNICYPKGYSFVDKTLLNLWCNVAPIAICLLLLFPLKLVSCSRRSASFFNENNHAVIIIKTAFQLLTIFFIPISKGLVDLINCVQIIDEGRNTAVLYGEASVVCLQLWQYIPLLILILYILPFTF